MGSDGSPAWVKWIAGIMICAVIVGFFIEPGVAAMITLHYEGNMYGPTSEDATIHLRGWDAFFFGLKLTFGGLAILAIPAALIWWVNRDD